MNRPTEPGPSVIDISIDEVAQLFHSLDPSPFRARDLDAAVEAYVTAWARELPRDTRLLLRIRLTGALPDGETDASLGAAVRAFFVYRADRERADLRSLLRRGRQSLAIGVAFLILCVMASEWGRGLDPPFAWFVSESLLIAGWVAMWRPIQIFLYDWWPLVATRRLFDRLATMDVRFD